MRAELPWNVAGIPPEAREAARAAARREGLSVGEWLTRRILRSFSDMGEEPPPMPFDRSYERPGMDPWGLPPSSASRRDTEEMLSRVSRTEAESSDAYRRIEEHLRTVTRRLDSTERSQSENNRAMNKTATEINIATREQAQAFDQMGSHVMALSDRLERLERGAGQDGLKDAVKGLHQGLSRLADQITQTANHSATQVTSLAGNLEQLAGRLGHMRAEVEETTRRLELRVVANEDWTKNRIAAFETGTARDLDQRLAALEKASQFNTNALDHALEKLEAQASIRAGDQAGLQKRHAETDGDIARLKENIERLQARSDDPAPGRRMDSIERALGSLVSRLETHDPAAALEDTLRALTRRIDTVEKSHNELLQELRANLAGGGNKAAPHGEPSHNPGPDADAFDRRDVFTSQNASLEAPPFVEAAPPFAGEPPGPQLPEFDPNTAFGSQDAALHEDPFAPDALATGAFASTADFTATTAADENFLSAARRSIRANAQAETARSGRFFLGGAPAEGGDAPRPRYLMIGLIGAIVLVGLFALITFSQRLHQGGRSGGLPATPAAEPRAPLANNGPFTPAPQNLPSPTSAPNLKMPPLQPRAVRPAPVRPVPVQQAPAAAPMAKSAPVKNSVPTLDHVTQLANGGNAIAQTILGLKELDGDGVPPNPADAAKWLERAAEQGQAVAQYRLGTMYERGQGVTADPAKAAHWYQAAANQGNRKAMHNLAVAYAQGSTGKKDMAEAARWFAKAAGLGLSDSQFNLAVLYERGDGVPQSLLDAYKWYAIAAAQGDGESKTRLGVLGSQLSDDDRNAAQKSAATFHAAPLDRAANVAPVMADLAGK